MKKVLFTFAATAIALALTPVALANSLTFNHDSATITLVSDNPADQGMVTLTDFAYIENTSGTKSLTIQGFEFYLGGASVTGAASDTPSTFLAADNDWTYSIGEGDLTPSAKNAKGTKWAKNERPPHRWRRSAAHQPQRKRLPQLCLGHQQLELGLLLHHRSACPGQIARSICW